MDVESSEAAEDSTGGSDSGRVQIPGEHRGQQVAANAADKVQRNEVGAAVDAVDRRAEVAERVHVDGEVAEGRVEEHRRNQPVDGADWVRLQEGRGAAAGASEGRAELLEEEDEGSGDEEVVGG